MNLHNALRLFTGLVMVFQPTLASSNWKQKTLTLQESLNTYERGTIAINNNKIFASTPTSTCSVTVDNCGAVHVINANTLEIETVISPIFEFHNQFFGEKLATNTNGFLVTGQYVSYTGNPQTSQWILTVYKDNKLYFLEEFNGVLKDVAINDNDIILITMDGELIILAPAIGSWSQIDRVQFPYTVSTKLTNEVVAVAHDNLLDIYILDALGHVLRYNVDSFVLDGDIASMASDYTGNLLFIGSTNTSFATNTTMGKVHIFKRQDVDWSEITSNIWYPSAFTPSTFGYTIAMSDNSKFLAVGAYGDPFQNTSFTPGAIFLYEDISGTFVLRDKVYSSEPQHDSYFGYDFKITNNAIIAKKNGYKPGQLHVLFFDIQQDTSTSFIIGTFLTILFILSFTVICINRRTITNKMTKLYEQI